MIYQISCELKDTAKNSTLIHKHLKKFGRWAQVLSSSYLVETSLEADKLRDHFRPFLLEGDKLFVIQAVKNWSSYRLSKSVAGWLKRPGRSWEAELKVEG